MSDVNVNEDPNAGLTEVAENREEGLVGTLVAWAFITCTQPCFPSISTIDLAHERDLRK